MSRRFLSLGWTGEVNERSERFRRLRRTGEVKERSRRFRRLRRTGEVKERSRRFLRLILTGEFFLIADAQSGTNYAFFDFFQFNEKGNLIQFICTHNSRTEIDGMLKSFENKVSVYFKNDNVSYDFFRNT